MEANNEEEEEGKDKTGNMVMDSEAMAVTRIW